MKEGISWSFFQCKPGYFFFQLTLLNIFWYNLQLQKQKKKNTFLPSILLLLTQNESEPYLAVSFNNGVHSVINKCCQKKPSILSIVWEQPLWICSNFAALACCKKISTRLQNCRKNFIQQASRCANITDRLTITENYSGDYVNHRVFNSWDNFYKLTGEKGS